MADYPFSPAAPVNTRSLVRARSFAHGAADQLSLALAFDGESDARRDDAMDEAVAALNEALRLIADARSPTLPLVPRAIITEADAVAVLDSGLAAYAARLEPVA